MCIQMGKTLDDPDRLKFETEEFYLKSEDEMRALFPQCPEAIDNTMRIAEACNLDFEFGVHHLPEFKLPPGETDGDAYFEKLCRKASPSAIPTHARNTATAWNSRWK
jgi:DNA polymerase-3 subunit alpha